MEPTLRKIFLAGIGAVSVTKEKVEELIDDLVKKGEIEEEEKAKFVKETMAKVDERSHQLKAWIEGAVEKATQKMKPKFQKDIQTLGERVAGLEKEIAKLRKEMVRQKKSSQ